MTEDDIKKSGRHHLKVNRHLAGIRSVLKTPAGRLESVGKAFVQQAVRNGCPQTKIAEWLEIAPSAVSYHVK